MKKILLFLTATALLLVFTAAQGWGQIISQYIETDDGTTPKGIEIWNNTGASLDFSTNNLVIEKGVNGGTPSPDYTLSSGTLTSGSVIVIGTSDMQATTEGNGSTFYLKTFTFNGDDALVVKYGGTITDMFGLSGNDPGSAWTGNGVSTANQNIQLKTGISAGDVDGWTDPSVRFETVNTNPSGTNGDEGFGLAPSAGSGPDDPTSFSATASSASQIDLAFASNAATDNVVIAHNGTGTFTAPSGAPPTVGQAFAGGTLLYNGTTSPQNHTGLTANETVYYKAWSYDNTDYSTGLTDDATTYASEPSSHPTAFSATSNSSSEITVAWTDAASTEHYLIKGSDVSYAAIVAPTDGVVESNSLLVQNVAQGVETHQFTSLSASTTYYFKIYPYNGTGTTVNYKTNETVPQDDATTDNAQAIVINEFLADPIGAGDANGDGTTDALEDEFIELYNNSSTAINITGYKIKDALATNHIFPVNSYIEPNDVIVVFGGGTPTGFDHLDVQIASTGGLSLNNSGDDITITDADDNVLVTYTYGSEGGSNQSLTRNPDITGSFFGHTTTTGAAVFSPAKKIDDTFFKRPTVWTGLAKSNAWAASGNWTVAVPTGANRAVIPAGATTYPTITAAAICNCLRMKDGATLLGGEYLTINGTAQVQKTIAEYTSNTDGWNVISVPVNGMAMAGSDFVPVVDEDDLYAYDQADNIWRNYHDVVNPAAWFDYFDVGTGYLVAYATDNGGIKNFVGALNTDASYAVSISNSNTAWDLIGNPYPSNITWADVTLTNASSPKVINTSTGAWDDLGTILETGQGIFVYAEGGGANVTFARADQTHTAPTKKAMTTDQVKFIADFGGKSVSLALIVNETATQSYEWQYDARYLYPVTTIPYLCAITEDDVWVSKYAFGSQNLETTIIPLFFQVSNEQSITFSLDNFSKEIGVAKITLEDKSNGNLTVLTNGDNYTYQASPDDQTDRFILHVETVTSIYEITQLEGVSIYGYNNNIYIRSELNTPAKVLVYNMFGQEVYHSSMELNGLQSFNLNAKTGWYIVQVVAEMGVKTEKVFVK